MTEKLLTGMLSLNTNKNTSKQIGLLRCVAILRPLQQYFSHIRMRKRLTWKVLCTKVGFESETLLSESLEHKPLGQANASGLFIKVMTTNLLDLWFLYADWVNSLLFAIIHAWTLFFLQQGQRRRMLNGTTVKFLNFRTPEKFEVIPLNLNKKVIP